MSSFRSGLVYCLSHTNCASTEVACVLTISGGVPNLSSLLSLLQLTALVTSFYLKLSEHFCYPPFLQQIREIGFLAQFESLLSTFGL